MLRFYFDHNMSPAVARGLQRRGVDVLIAMDDGTSTWDDESILIRATELDRVVCTEDSDFLTISARWVSEGREFPGIVFLRQQDVSIGVAVNELEMCAKVISTDEMQGRIHYLPL
jgi:predicted nuclease of predicted toxin-antitoxin system